MSEHYFIFGSNNIRNWIEDHRPDAVEMGVAEYLVETIEDEPHPNWGSDWSDFIERKVAHLMQRL
jgi:hypothetical protein